MQYGSHGLSLYFCFSGSEHKTKDAQLAALVEELSLYFHEDEAKRIPEKTLTEHHPNTVAVTKERPFDLSRIKEVDEKTMMLTSGYFQRTKEELFPNRNILQISK